MKVSPLIGVITDFFRRTTLHGFKYLGSRFCLDRIMWVLVCCASACSAGVLCAVLWARFMQQPAIVALNDTKDLTSATSGMPLVIVCPPADFIANRVVVQFKPLSNESWLSSALEHVIRKKKVREEHLLLLDKRLDDLGMALPDALIKYSPECRDMIVSCRWQNHQVPCRKLFWKQFTDWGLCCVLNPIRLQSKRTKRLFDHLETTRRLDIALTCDNSSFSYYGYEVLPLYHGDEYITPQMLHRGLSYWLQVTYTRTLDNEGSLLDVDAGCVPYDGYSRLQCIARCLEKICGCSDPLVATDLEMEEQLPQCRVAQLNCLRVTKGYENSSCGCLPPCSQLSTEMSVETNKMDFVDRTFDPLYAGLNSSISNVVYIRVRMRQSKVFFLLPTETWLTLLSSLGGVFNMFLGVGLFSALEILFLIIFKLPLALKRSAEINVPDTQ